MSILRRALVAFDTGAELPPSRRMAVWPRESTLLARVVTGSAFSGRGWKHLLSRDTWLARMG